VSHWTFRVGDRLVSAKVQGRFTASSVEGIHQACLGGLGIALLSYWEVEEELAAGRLAEVRLDGAEPETLAIWAVYPTRRMVPSKVRLFIQALSADLQERGLLPA
jgi:DNA-binding transcriptional LysR family regulator